MKKHKRGILFVFVVVIVFSLLSCQTPPVTESTTSLTSGATETQKELSSFTILGPEGAYYTFDKIQTMPSWEHLSNMFAAKGVILDIQAAAQDQYATVLQATIASNNLPDFFHATPLPAPDLIRACSTNPFLKSKGKA